MLEAELSQFFSGGFSIFFSSEFSNPFFWGFSSMFTADFPAFPVVFYRRLRDVSVYLAEKIVALPLNVVAG